RRLPRSRGRSRNHGLDPRRATRAPPTRSVSSALPCAPPCRGTLTRREIACQVVRIGLACADRGDIETRGRDSRGEETVMAVAVSVEQQADSFVRSSHKLMIDGEWVEAASGQTFETLNPATEEVLAEIAYGQAEDIDRAVKAARKAFADDSPWRRMNA